MPASTPGTVSVHRLGQSIWVDNITRTMLDDGTLARYIADWAVTGLTSNPTIFEKAIAGGKAYDASIRALLAKGLGGEKLFFKLAIEDLTRAADLFRPIHRDTQGVDGWVSLEVSPLLANDTAATIAQARELHAQAGRNNLFIKVPGTPEGLPAIEQLIFDGIPVNVTLLFDREQYLAAADAYLKGLERRLAKGLDLKVCSVASLFVSRWDKATAAKLPADLKNRLGIAMAERCYKAFCDLKNSTRFQKLKAAGARPQRLLFASTGVKDPSLAGDYYVQALAAPDTVNTMPEETLQATAKSSTAAKAQRDDGGDCEGMLARITKAGVDVARLGADLQVEGRDSFDKSWSELLSNIESKTASLAAR
ncbi:MAG: transaldolase [Phycisphaerae bacterium]|nr:transaldolase [Phycisphaerae bacterium]